MTMTTMMMMLCYLWSEQRVELEERTEKRSNNGKHQSRHSQSGLNHHLNYHNYLRHHNIDITIIKITKVKKYMLQTSLSLEDYGLDLSSSSLRSTDLNTGGVQQAQGDIGAKNISWISLILGVSPTSYVRRASSSTSPLQLSSSCHFHIHHITSFIAIMMTRGVASSEGSGCLLVGRARQCSGERVHNHASGLNRS